jgi:hypothetical protein
VGEGESVRAFGPTWLATNSCPTKIMAIQNFALQKSRLAKVRAKSIHVHLVECHNNNMKHFFSLMQFKKFLEICQNFGHKHWLPILWQ